MNIGEEKCEQKAKKKFMKDYNNKKKQIVFDILLILKRILSRQIGENKKNITKTL